MSPVIFLFLDELELLGPEAFLDHGLLALEAPEPDVHLLGRLVAARHLGELTAVTDAKGPGLLALDPRESRGPSLLDLLDLVLGVSFAMWTVRLVLLRHLHMIFTFLRLG